MVSPLDAIAAAADNTARLHQAELTYSTRERYLAELPPAARAPWLRQLRAWGAHVTGRAHITHPRAATPA